jgi:asparagine synthase (glutamine-hydrolysing)
MTSAMAYRGPDGIHHWVKGSVALGHCMLRTTPESLEEQQPLANEDESLVLVMDGRLDNREELQRAFRAHGINLRGQTDAELVLAAYQLWGEDSPNHLLGDFAYAVWDARRQACSARGTISGSSRSTTSTMTGCSPSPPRRRCSSVCRA